MDGSLEKNLALAKERTKIMQIKSEYALRDNDLQEAIIKGFPKDSYEVTSVYLEGRPTADQPESNSEHIKYFDLLPGEMKGLRIKAMWRLYNFCRDNTFDVVYLNRYKPISMMLILNKFLRIPKCIGIIHGLGDLDRLYRRRTIKRLIDSRWKVVSVSNAVRNELIAYDCGLNESNTVTIPNAIAVNDLRAGQLEPAVARKALGSGEKTFVFGTIGRLVPVKGHKYLLDAFSKLIDKYNDIELVIIGDGELEIEYQSWIKKHGLDDRVHLTGFLENAYKFTSAFNCFVLPSLSEGMPLAIMEAMAALLPIIATDVGGNKEVLGDLVETIPAKDVDILCRKMEEMLLLPAEERKRKGQSLFNRVLQHYDIEMYKKKYRDLAVT